MDFDQLKYNVKETIRIKGAWYFLWRIGLAVLIIWWLWPESDPVISHKIKDVAVDLAEDEPREWHNIADTPQDLRKIITTTQSVFYWDSFNWMMEYGVAEKPRSFESKILKVRFLMSDIFDGEKKMKCRTFREKLVVTGKANSREGIACKRAGADWCKQIKGERFQCRTQPSDDLIDIDMDHFNIKMKRHMNSLPSF